MLNDSLAEELKKYKGKRVLVTGHTGFKGSWICKILCMLGAEVTGYALAPTVEPALFTLCNLEQEMNSVIGDIRDLEYLHSVFEQCRPEIVIHMAAQPIVRESYRNPVDTYAINVMGTVNVLECVRNTESVCSFLNVTTDKVYLNKEWEWGYREYEELNGHDPYSNSKSCSELVTSSYKNSFFKDGRVAISTARAGNVIGGGDFATDRIIPDCVRAALENRDIIVRNPLSIRPYQHVLEPVTAYLLIAIKQFYNLTFSGSYNIGPAENGCVTTKELVTLFCDKWRELVKQDIIWQNVCDTGPYEASCLKLDCAKMKHMFGWQASWNIEETMERLVEWYGVYGVNGDIRQCMKKQIMQYIGRDIFDR